MTESSKDIGIPIMLMCILTDFVKNTVGISNEISFEIGSAVPETHIQTNFHH